MSKKLRDGELESIVRRTRGRLVCAILGDPSRCAPCRAAEPVWNTLPPLYPKCEFYTIVTSECPSTSQNYQIRGIPTFLFFLNGNVVYRTEGFSNKQTLVDAIERYKPLDDFSGKAKKLQTQSDQQKEDFFASLRVVKDKPAKPVNENQSTIDDLLSMGFSQDVINMALEATNNGTLNDCLSWIEQNDNGEQENEEKPAPEVKEQPPEQEIVLTEAGQSLCAELIEMGFEEELAKKAVDYCDAVSIDKAIDYITLVQNGSEIPPKKKKMTEQEAKEYINQVRERAKQAEAALNSPEAVAKRELERRNQIKQEQERRELLEQKQREREIEQRRMEKIEQKREYERVRAKIRAEKEARKNEQAPVVAKSAAPSVKPKTDPTEAKLQLLFPDNSRKIMKFKADQTLRDVYNAIVSEYGMKNYNFETVIPKAMIPKGNWDQSLLNLNLAPRSQLVVKY